MKVELNRTAGAQREERAAKREAQEKLWRSYVAEARAGHYSQRLGQRFESLRALAAAAKLARELELDEDAFLQMRHEAIPCLGLLDLRPGSRPFAWPTNAFAADFDDAFHHYVRTDLAGGVSVRRVKDDTEVYHLTNLTPGESWPLLSRDGRLLAVRCKSGCRVWRLSGQHPKLVWKDDRLWPVVTFTRDGKHMALGHRDGSILILDTEKARRNLALSPSPPLVRLAFDPPGQRLAVGCHDRAQIRDLPDGRILWEFPYPWVAWPWVAWSADGKLLAALGGDRVIRIWNVRTHQLVAPLAGITNDGATFSFSHTGDMLVTNAWERVLRLWDVRTGKQLFQVKAERCGDYPRFRTDDGMLAGEIQDGFLRWWEVAIDREPKALGPAPAVAQMTYVTHSVSPDERLLAVQGETGFGLWDLVTRRFIEQVWTPGTPALAAQPGRLGAFLTNSPQGVYRWPIQRGQETGDVLRVGPPEKLGLPGSDHPPACSNNGLVVATAHGSRVFVLHRATNRVVALKPHDDTRYVAVSPDGRWVATDSHSASPMVQVWNAHTGVLVTELAAGAGGFLCFSHHGRWLATGGQGVRLWAIGSWKQERHFRGPSRAALAFSPDDRVLAFESSYGAVRLVATDTGREYARLEDPDQARASVLTFSASGSKLYVTSGETRQAYIWDLLAIRARLAAIGLNWDQAPYAADGRSNGTTRPRVQVVSLGAPVQATGTYELFEAESLPIVECSDCVPAFQSMSAFDATRWSNGGQLFIKANQSRSAVTLEVELPHSGRYELDAYLTLAPNFATVRVSLDGKALGQPFDLYSLQVAPSGKVQCGTLNLKAGRHRVRFAAIGKNPNSTGYDMGIDCLVFFPVK